MYFNSASLCLICASSFLIYSNSSSLRLLLLAKSSFSNIIEFLKLSESESDFYIVNSNIYWLSFSNFSSISALKIFISSFYNTGLDDLGSNVEG
jgi:hypothetical protein